MGPGLQKISRRLKMEKAINLFIDERMNRVSDKVYDNPNYIE